MFNDPKWETGGGNKIENFSLEKIIGEDFCWYPRLDHNNISDFSLSLHEAMKHLLNYGIIGRFLASFPLSDRYLLSDVL